MKKNLLTFLAISLLTVQISAQTAGFFQPVPEKAIALRDGLARSVFPEKYQTFHLDYTGIKTALQSAPQEFTAAAKAKICIISLPLADGTTDEISVWQTAIKEP